MISAIKLDTAILSNVNTNQLVYLYLYHPLLKDIFAYNDLQSGFRAFNQNFHIAEYLFSRKNIYDEIFSTYQTLLKDAKNNTLDIIFIQILLSQDQVINTLSDSLKNLIIDANRNYIQQQLNYPEKFGLFDLSVSTYLLSKLTDLNANDIENISNIQVSKIDHFLNNCSTLDKETIDIVLNHFGITLSNNSKLKQTTSENYVYVQTPNGTDT